MVPGSSGDTLNLSFRYMKFSNRELWCDHLPPLLEVREEVILPLSLSYCALFSGLNWKLIKNIENLLIFCKPSPEKGDFYNLNYNLL